MRHGNKSKRTGKTETNRVFATPTSPRGEADECGRSRWGKCTLSANTYTHTVLVVFQILFVPARYTFVSVFERVMVAPARRKLQSVLHYSYLPANGWRRERRYDFEKVPRGTEWRAGWGVL